MYQYDRSYPEHFGFPLQCHLNDTLARTNGQSLDAFKKQCSFWYLRASDMKVCPLLVFKVSKPKITHKTLTSLLDVCELLHAAAKFPRGKETREAIEEKGGGWKLRVSLYDLERRKISWHCRKPNQDSPVEKPVSYTLFWQIFVQKSLYWPNNYIYICYVRIRYNCKCVLQNLPPRWCLHLIVVRGFEYVSDPESYTSGSVATGRASLAGQVKG